ncbi:MULTISPECIES: hypothetical protein [unclassified Pseudomonas]|uniref:hypothetical protein n=1 Tax=unclassified Pseudomonas TaxID=196821 RepID=UPI001F16BDB4|nr:MULTISPECIES: hypothetical protein [unclassified Pseudomonas]MCF5232426.1 hypothetical protein [Pseudomonas sp. PA-5-4H]MCF5236853.1 hypothetical protein [Pseudomonas sp. PA-5-4G]MCF5248699.1 hypothetical protein [Pseudomonas sp. PA-5-4B]MCF5256779.1 hypothetical protein [Pseudomonas sp. PA-5-4B]MCF5263302.1 hypothetical protein [Pseudomonas sp. PA-5-4A]
MSSAERSAPRSSGKSIAVVGIALGLAVAVYISPKSKYFLGNFAYSWLPQSAVLFVAILCKASRGALGGIAAAMALYLYLFDIWATESLAWLFYLFSFPGILIGALLAIATPSRKAFEAPIAFAWAVLGIALGLVGVWFWAC